MVKTFKERLNQTKSNRGRKNFSPFFDGEKQRRILCKMYTFCSFPKVARATMRQKEGNLFLLDNVIVLTAEAKTARKNKNDGKQVKIQAKG